MRGVSFGHQQKPRAIFFACLRLLVQQLARYCEALLLPRLQLREFALEVIHLHFQRGDAILCCAGGEAGTSHGARLHVGTPIFKLASPIATRLCAAHLKFIQPAAKRQIWLQVSCRDTLAARWAPPSTLKRFMYASSAVGVLTWPATKKHRIQEDVVANRASQAMRHLFWVHKVLISQPHLGVQQLCSQSSTAKALSLRHQARAQALL
mmetsp:Transcript_36805/g.86295  ORF Transcript_36805/g.86295 Transcript_36805/m.86295 type:complete len:208 (+) Transcript_36805:1546-2169(+)